MFRFAVPATCSVLLLFAACTSTPPPPAAHPDETAALQKQVDAQQAAIDSLRSMVQIPENEAVPPPQHVGPPPAAEGAEIRTGTHDLTLQWIGWDQPGKAQIQKTDNGRYTIEGAQRKGEDYLQISGVLTPLSTVELLFDGKLVYRVSDLNGGLPCDKSGKQTFLSTRGRKYWRMQNMTNCEGGLVTDYVDIYF